LNEDVIPLDGYGALLTSPNPGGNGEGNCSTLQMRRAWKDMQSRIILGLGQARMVGDERGHF